MIASMRPEVAIARSTITAEEVTMLWVEARAERLRERIVGFVGIGRNGSQRTVTSEGCTRADMQTYSQHYAVYLIITAFLN
jgi:hypothetical protein